MKSHFLGISPLAMGTTQKYLKTQQEFKTQNTTLKFACIILLVITFFNTMFAVMMIYKNSLVMEENIQLIQENRGLIGFQQLMSQLYPSDIKHEDSSLDSSDTEKFANMIDMQFPRVDCPPCTTEKPTIVQPHKNPVSILNELTHYASYECDHQCLNPPIHFSSLSVTDPAFPEKTFSGKGESKQQSKQVAAYRALEFLFPEHLDQVADENKPNLDFSPICLSYIMMHNNKTKC